MASLKVLNLIIAVEEKRRQMKDIEIIKNRDKIYIDKTATGAIYI